MTAQSHHQRSRSLSVFSLEHFRPRGRAEAHIGQPKVGDETLHPPSNLSHNPNPKLQVVPEPNTAISNTITKGQVIDTPATGSAQESALPRLRDQTYQTKTSGKTRPRSWFPFSRPSLRKRHILGRSFSLRSPKQRCSPTVTRSMISAPVLTGTTNIDVAEAEGVCCRDIVDVGLTVSADERPSKTTSNNIFSHVHPNKWGLFRRASTGQDRRERADSFILAAIARHDTKQHSEGSWRFSAIERGVSRRRAETVNLCRQKINKLTGNGNIKRKSINKDIEKALSTTTAGAGHDDARGDDNIVQPQTASQPHAEEGRILALPHDDLNLHSESLSKSFATAVDRLETRSSSPSIDKMMFMKMKQSLLSLRKRKHKEDDDEIQQSGTTTKSDDDLSQPNAPLAEAANTGQSSYALGQQDEIGFPASPSQFSAAANAYVPSPPVRPYPKGVKVLGMHSRTTDFATAPSWVTDLPPPIPNPQPIDQITATNDDDDEQVIEDAPIYSPSLGDLNQYARATPPSAQSDVNPRRRPEPETPTRAATEKGLSRRFGLGRSKSGLGLLSLFNKGQKDGEKGSGGSLQPGDANPRMSKMQQLKKSRSMNIPALLKRGERSVVKEPTHKEHVHTTTQPVKPSPLRYEAKEEEDNTAKQSPAALASHKRTPPRGSVTPAERAKRMGIIGMPQDNFDIFEEQH